MGSLKCCLSPVVAGFPLAPIVTCAESLTQCRGLAGGAVCMPPHFAFGHMEGVCLGILLRVPPDVGCNLAQLNIVAFVRFGRPGNPGEIRDGLPGHKP